MNDPLDGYNPFVGEQQRPQPANWSNTTNPLPGGEKTTKTTLVKITSAIELFVTNVLLVHLKRAME